MAHYRTTIDSVRSVEDTFDYMARFSNARFWDPTVVDASLTSPEPVGQGSTFSLSIHSMGRTSEWRYKVIEFTPSSKVVLRAKRGSLVSLDTVTVRARPGGGAEVTYDADLRLSGLARFADPLLNMAFQRLGARAKAGLARELGPS